MICNLCGQANPVGASPYSYNTDKNSLAELSSGSYEFEVGGRYIYRSMRNPTYVFLVDTSVESIQQGILSSLINGLKNTLDSIPNPENTHLAIVTVGSNVHCY